MIGPFQQLAGLRGKFRVFLADEGGATAIEYAMIASGIAGAIIATVYAIGPELVKKYESVNSSFK